jgi:hypothetical protein
LGGGFHFFAADVLKFLPSLKLSHLSPHVVEIFRNLDEGCRPDSLPTGIKESEQYLKI